MCIYARWASNRLLSGIALRYSLCVSPTRYLFSKSLCRYTDGQRLFSVVLVSEELVLSISAKLTS